MLAGGLLGSWAQGLCLLSKRQPGQRVCREVQHPGGVRCCSLSSLSRSKLSQRAVFIAFQLFSYFFHFLCGCSNLSSIWVILFFFFGNITIGSKEKNFLYLIQPSNLSNLFSWKYLKIFNLHKVPKAEQS